MSALLSAERVSKHFGGLAALSEISFSIGAGEIYGLIGPNGAGKTTLFNVITGLYPANSGYIIFDARPLTGLTPHEIVERGLVRTFQNIRLFANMTALENVMVGRHVRSRAGIMAAVFRGKRARAEESAIAECARELLTYMGIAQHADALAKNLSYGDQRRLEIARALATEPKLLALDEPAAGMNVIERIGLKELLKKLRDDGITLLLIEHDVSLVMGLCDRVAVLDYGKKIADGAPSEVQSNPKVIKAYLGGEGE